MAVYLPNPSTAILKIPPHITLVQRPTRRNARIPTGTSCQITLNEAMILCALKEASDKVTATNLSKQTELSPSHTSKMLRILEEKGLIVRSLGSEDRRQMYFHLTQLGKQRVTELELDKVEIPDLLKPLF